MIFRQMFDSVSSTYTYVMASLVGGAALIIDPVFEKTDKKRSCYKGYSFYLKAFSRSRRPLIVFPVKG